MTVFSRWCVKLIAELDEYDLLDFFDYMKKHTFVRGGKEKKYSPVTIHTHKIIVQKFLKSLGRTEFHEIFRIKPRGKRKLTVTLAGAWMKLML